MSAMLPFDITANRHKGNAESAAANQQIHETKERQRERVYRYVLSRGYEGATINEIAEWMGVADNRISGRVSELLTLGRLFRTERKRKTKSGCNARVLIAARRAA